MARRADAMNRYFDHWATASCAFILLRIQLSETHKVAAFKDLNKI